MQSLEKEHHIHSVCCVSGSSAFRRWYGTNATPRTFLTPFPSCLYFPVLENPDDITYLIGPFYADPNLALALLTPALITPLKIWASTIFAAFYTGTKLEKSRGKWSGTSGILCHFTRISLESHWNLFAISESPESPESLESYCTL